MRLLDLGVSLSTAEVECMGGCDGADTPMVSSILPRFVAAIALSPNAGIQW